MSEKAVVPCPICKQPSEFFAEPVGPFCSNRCKMVDFGKWMNEEYVISEPLRPDHFEDLDDLDMEGPNAPRYM